MGLTPWAKKLARLGGPCPPRGARGMLPWKILKFYSCIFVKMWFPRF